MYRLVAAILAAGLMHPTASQAQQACDDYRVQSGDTLRNISERAFGSDEFAALYEANAEEIGQNPNLIQVGSVLRIPCADGALPPAAPASGAGQTISFVTAGGYVPYTDENLDNRGFVTHLVSQAMLRGAPNTALDIVFINDWGAHLDTLLPRQAFDASFPWTETVCTGDCDVVYSDPIYDIVEGFFVRSGSGLEEVATAAGFNETRMCRPEGYPLEHLDQTGVLSNVSLSQPTTAQACFDQLMTGSVDVVSIDTRAGAHVLGQLNLKSQVTENPFVFSIQSLRVAFHKDNPQTEAMLADLNRGIAIMLKSGEWDSIVQKGLQPMTAPELVN